MIRPFLIAIAVASSVAGVLTGIHPAEASTRESVASIRSWTPEQLVEGVVFLHGELGARMIERGALGDLASADRATVTRLLSSQNARNIASQASREVIESHPETVAALTGAIADVNPVALESALRQLADEAIATKSVESHQTDGASDTYIPGEAGVDCFFNVVVGGYLVIAVAGVALGVAAMVSVVLVGDIKVAGKNAAQKKSDLVSTSDEKFVASIIESA